MDRPPGKLQSEAAQEGSIVYISSNAVLSTCREPAPEDQHFEEDEHWRAVLRLAC